MKGKRIVLACIAIVAALALAGFLTLRLYVFAKYGYEPVRVEVPANATDSEMKTIFTDALGKSFGSKVARLWAMQHGTAKKSHGSYLVNHGDEAIRVARAIAQGRQTPVKLTFNNMRQISELASRAAQVMEFDSVTFMSAVKSALSTKGYSPEEYAAAFLPDTYEFYWTDDPLDVVEKIAAHRDRFWTPERTAKAKALGLTPTEVHTLASIAEEESNRSDERGKVARLYLNRLEKGMYLQADPTVKFASKSFGLRRISGDVLRTDSPYNTYRYKGLPPGPIRIAEAATIDSILESAPHNYLYMCARSDFSGYHDFAETYDRHRINAARYHRALDARGIK